MREPNIASEIMSTIPSCSSMHNGKHFPDGDNYVCADCGHEWSMQAAASADDDAAGGQGFQWHGTGEWRCGGVDPRNLKVKGSSITLKMGPPRSKHSAGRGDHEVDCRDGWRQLHAQGLLPEEGLTINA